MKSDAPATNRRRIKLIDRDFQYKLMAKFIAVNALILGFFDVLLYLFFRSEISANLSAAHVTYKNMSEMLLPIALSLSLLSVLVASLVIVAVVLYASHKIAGPMFRFKAVLEAMKQGDLKVHTGLRADDQLRELAGSLGDLRDALAKDLTALKSASDLEEVKRIVGRYEL